MSRQPVTQRNSFVLTSSLSKGASSLRPLDRGGPILHDHPGVRKTDMSIKTARLVSLGAIGCMLLAPAIARAQGAPQPAPPAPQQPPSPPAQPPAPPASVPPAPPAAEPA